MGEERLQREAAMDVVIPHKCAHYGQGLKRLLKEVPNLFLREFGRASEKQNIKTGI